MFNTTENAERERRERKFAVETGTSVAIPASTAVAVPDNRSACDQYLDEIAPASIVGRLIKFKKGKFVLADDDTEIGQDEDFVCLADMTMIGWVKFNKKASRRQLAFAVSWRHQQHKPVDLAALDAFELLGNLLMKSCRLVSGIRVAGKFN